MQPKDDDKALRDAVLSAIRLWTYDNDAETVAALKGEDGHTYSVQYDLVARITQAVRKAGDTKP